MIRYKVVRFPLLVLFVLGLSRSGGAQIFPFTSGPIPLCATSTFTANVSGMGTLQPPGWTPWSYSLQSLTINITSDHPQTLRITLTSPAGTELLLSEFNGAGGQNYTNTTFLYGGATPITTGTAPFTGNWTAQGGDLSVFDYEWADGTWTITVVDTACANGGTGPGGLWTPGWFDGSAGGGGFAFAFNGPPPCWGGIPSDAAYVCSGQAVDILGYYMANNPSYTYNITLGGTPIADPSAVTTPGTYFVDAFDPWEGCSYWGTYDVILTTPSSLGADQVVDQCSSAGPVDLTALFIMSGGMPMWSLDGTPIANATAGSATDPGVYQLIEENTGGCNDTALVTLNITAGPVLGPDQSVGTCPGASIDLTALYTTTGSSSVAWTFGGAPFLTPTAATDAGVYTLSVTSASGCTDMADVTLDVQGPSSLGADQSIDLCDNTSLDLTALYTTTGLTASWTFIGVPVPTPAAVYQGGTYQLVAANNGGCTDTALVVVTVNLSPTLGPDLVESICENEAADLTIFFPTAGLTTSWTLSGAAVPSPIAVYAAGLYTLIATNASGCSDTARTEVEVYPLPVLGPDQSVTECDGTVVDLTALYATGANATAWTEGGAPVADPTSVTSAGSFTLTATNAAGCAALAVVTVAFDPAPALGSDQSSSICEGSTFDLTSLYAAPGLTTAWTLGGASVADPSAVDATGNYQLVVTNGLGCADAAVVSLTVNSSPALGADLSLPLCPWQTVNLGTAFPVDGMPASYTLDGQTVGDPTSVSDPGTYVVTVTDANGCSDEATASVSNIECLCEADFVHDANCFQDPAHFTLLADSTILGANWDFDVAATTSTVIDPVVLFASEGDVLVTLQATLSCGVVEVQRTIAVQDCAALCNVWIPSTFTPDKDGINDTWTWNGACEPADFSVEIYDRWGEIVFASKDPMKTWDGTDQDGWSPTGVYGYRVGYRLPYQDRKEVMGSITLVR